MIERVRTSRSLQPHQEAHRGRRDPERHHPQSLQDFPDPVARRIIRRAIEELLLSALENPRAGVELEIAEPQKDADQSG